MLAFGRRGGCHRKPARRGDRWRTRTQVLAISLGGVLGVNARIGWASSMNRWAAVGWATFTINISGSFAIGILSIAFGPVASPSQRPAHDPDRIPGEHSTPSITRARARPSSGNAGRRTKRLAYLGGSVVLGLIAALLGMALGREPLISQPGGGLPIPRKESPPAPARRGGMGSAGREDAGLS